MATVVVVEVMADVAAMVVAAVEMVVVKNGWRVYAQTHVRSPNVVWGPPST